jgi:protein associated with RNAse G/E
VNQPPSFDGHVLNYIDLDVDVLVAPDFTYRILDLEDFEENAKRYAYPVEVQANARRALKELTALIESRAFPFDE